MGDEHPSELELLEEHYHRAPCGFVSTRMDGTVVQVNDTLLSWVGLDRQAVVGAKFGDLLTPGSRLFYETKFAPLVHLQHEVRDAAFELRTSGHGRLPVLVSSNLVVDAEGTPRAVRTSVFDATSRREHERQLRAARDAAKASEQAMHTVAVQLQRSLLPAEVDQAPGFRVTTRYRPAVEDLEVGGDWYDAVRIPGRDVLSVSVGDVVGRGIVAACAMGQLRSALRAIAMAGVGPGAALDQLDDFVERVPDGHAATVVCAEVDLDHRTLRFACAGHLPPLLVRPDGGAELLWDGRSTPLASVRPPGGRPEGEVALEPGSAVLLFTDGLVERRTQGLDEGLDRLVTTVEGLVGASADELLDGVMASMLEGEEARDDVCVLLLTAEA